MFKNLKQFISHLFVKEIMKLIYLSSVLLFLFSCEKGNSHKGKEKLGFVSNEQKWKNEANRDVESLDFSIKVNKDDLERFSIELSPSFHESHRIIVNLLEDPKTLYVRQTSHILENYTPENLHQLNSIKLRDEQYKMMMDNRTIEFQIELNQSEIEKLRTLFKPLKQSSYKSKFVRQYDGMTTQIFLEEKDTLAIISTNRPSKYQKEFIQSVLQIAHNGAKDSISKKNMNSLMEYL